MNTRLSKSQWVEHGLRTLAEQGPNALKIGALAAGLNVSRGSFYWHFRDLADFQGQLLQSWSDRTTHQVIRELESESDEPARLMILLLSAFDLALDVARSIRTLDRAIRSWAADDPAVARVVSEVDAVRVGYIARLLAKSGLDPQRAQSRAAFLYWAYLGQPGVMNGNLAAIAAPELREIIGLFEG